MKFKISESNFRFQSRESNKHQIDVFVLKTKKISMRTMKEIDKCESKQKHKQISHSPIG